MDKAVAKFKKYIYTCDRSPESCETLPKGASTKVESQILSDAKIDPKQFLRIMEENRGRCDYGMQKHLREMNFESASCLFNRPHYGPFLRSFDGIPQTQP